MLKNVRTTRYLLPVALILFMLLFSPNVLAKVGQITQYEVFSSPGSITAGPDGNLWFTAAFKVNEIVRITPGGQLTPVRYVPPQPWQRSFSLSLAAAGGPSELL